MPPVERVPGERVTAGLRITGVEARAVRVPIIRPAVMARAIRSHVTRTIVEVATEGGLVGIGETRGEPAALAINRRFAPALLGCSAVDRHAARDRCLPPLIDWGLAPEQRLELMAFSAVEMALWDLLGKACGLPLYALLGGVARERAPFVAYLYGAELLPGQNEADIPGLMADLAARRIAATGSALLEMKVGIRSTACDSATIKRVREALGPAVGIALDANMGMSLAAARAFLDAAAPCGIENFEEPTPRLADYARLQDEYRISTSTHCTELDLLAAAARGRAPIDAVVSDLHYHGGIGPIRDLAVAATARGHRFWLRSSWELGISWAAMCHVALATPLIERPSQGLIDLVADDLIEGEPWLLRDGGVRPPDAPGLGVMLDRAALERYAI
jgi:glucarate dehydratase